MLHARFTFHKRHGHYPYLHPPSRWLKSIYSITRINLFHETSLKHQPQLANKLRKARQSEAALRLTTVQTIPKASSKRNVQEQNTREQNAYQAKRTGTRTPGTRTQEQNTQEQNARQAERPISKTP